jgi:hypothetical protein
MMSEDMNMIITLSGITNTASASPFPHPGTPYLAQLHGCCCLVLRSEVECTLSDQPYELCR